MLSRATEPGSPPPAKIRQLLFWDAATGRPLSRIGNPSRGFGPAAFSPVDDTLAIALTESLIGFEIAPGRMGMAQLGFYSHHAGEINGLAFSPDGKLAATAAYDGSLRLYKTEDFRPKGADPRLQPISEAHQWPGHVGIAASIAFSPDGKTLASAGTDGIKLWEVPTGLPIKGFGGDAKAGVSAVAWVSGGKRVAAGGNDGVLTVWDVESGKPVSKGGAHKGGVSSIAATADGMRSLHRRSRRLGQVVDAAGVAALNRAPARPTRSPTMDVPSLRVDGTVALVTGAGSGLGRAMAIGLARNGADVAITELPGREADAAGTVAEVQAAGRRAFAVPLDVTNLPQINAAVDAVLAQFGRIDILVNNAGVNIPKPAVDVTEQDWDRVLDVNLKGVFFVAQAVGKRTMIPQKRGKIVNIASQNGVVGYYNRAAYCAAKAGVVNLTRVLAIEWAEHGIQVNGVGPTFVLTPLTRPTLEDPVKGADILRRIPAGRLGKPEDIIGAVVFLASPAADLVTGQTLMVDGGWTAI